MSEKPEVIQGGSVSKLVPPGLGLLALLDCGDVLFLLGTHLMVRFFSQGKKNKTYAVSVCKFHVYFLHQRCFSTHRRDLAQT